MGEPSGDSAVRSALTNAAKWVAQWLVALEERWRRQAFDVFRKRISLLLTNVGEHDPDCVIIRRQVIATVSLQSPLAARQLPILQKAVDYILQQR